MPRHKVTGPVGLIPDSYKVLAMAVETGIALGWNRARKHVDDPSPEAIREAIHEAVMTECAEWFQFPDSFAIRE
jgi:hypothetical protein